MRRRASSPRRGTRTLTYLTNSCLSFPWRRGRRFAIIATVLGSSVATCSRYLWFPTAILENCGFTSQIIAFLQLVILILQDLEVSSFDAVGVVIGHDNAVCGFPLYVGIRIDHLRCSARSIAPSEFLLFPDRCGCFSARPDGSASRSPQ